VAAVTAICDTDPDHLRQEAWRALAVIQAAPVSAVFPASQTKRPYIPHEYTVRDKQDPSRETVYVQLFHLIQADGVIERWRGPKKRYLYPGDGWKYWATTTVEPKSRVLNRMRIEDDPERPRQAARFDGPSRSRASADDADPGGVLRGQMRYGADLVEVPEWGAPVALL